MLAFRHILILSFFLLISCSNQHLDELTLMKRTSCLLISRNFVHTLENKLTKLLIDLSESQQMQSLWKLYGYLGVQCETSISESQMQQFYSQNDEFRIENYYYLVSDIDLFSVLSDTNLNKQQQQIVKFHKDFDANRQKSHEKKEQQEGWDTL